MIAKKRLLFLLLLAALSLSESAGQVKLVSVGEAWSANSVNANILRHNSVISHDAHQYVAYYNASGRVVLAKRQLGSEQWDIRQTSYRGRLEDAHNVISIMIDGAGYLHMSWDHHGNRLRYCRSLAPGSLELTELMPMTGLKEDNVTYPEFYRLPDGDLLFLYRDGASGRGNLMMNHYDFKLKKWTQRQDAFIHGEGERNAYWQTCTDSKGVIHISWVWRESGDVATNHDLAYAKSTDGGKTWQRSNGVPYVLPITDENAEYATRIPQGHELINTTSMCADSEGRPYIATYFRPEGTSIPQYHLIYHNGEEWQTQQISKRLTPFSLSGGGTKRIPISRPCIVATTDGSSDQAYILFRDIERGNRVSVAICKDLEERIWQIRDLTDFSVGMWEPSYDTEIWKRSKGLHIYVQNVGQGDGETTEEILPQMVSILEWYPEQVRLSGTPELVIN